MSDLLTRDEYQAIASRLTIAHTPFIDGKFQGGEGDDLKTFNPATGELISTLKTASPDAIDFAVAKAREAFDQGRWAKKHPTERKEILVHFAKLIYRNRRELAVLESLDSGKPIRDCEEIDLPETIHTIKWHAEAIDKIYDQVGPSGDDAISMIVREPIGVVAAVLPWNFPLLMMAWKIGPALAAGNSVLIKPAEQTSLTALRLAQIGSEAGLPAGVLQVLPGDGPHVGEPIGRHADIDMVSFTGSTDTGRRFLSYAAESNLKRVVLECGGKNPAVVLEDADHLDLVASHLVNAAFWNMGENCSACSRLIVHKKVKEPLVERMLARIRDWSVGDPLDPKNRLGALIDGDHAKKVASYLSDLGSAQVISGGEMTGPYLAPTILDAVPHGHRAAQEEIFGPILSVLEVASYEEAITLANETPYGLAASVFTANAKKALRAARDIKAGTVTVNCYGEGNISTPFGGYKESGFGGRDNGIHAHDQFTETKTIWIDLSDEASSDEVA